MTHVFPLKGAWLLEFLEQHCPCWKTAAGALPPLDALGEELIYLAQALHQVLW